MQFTQEEINIIAGALCVAASVYKQTAADLSDNPEQSRIAAQFSRQERQASELAMRIEVTV